MTRTPVNSSALAEIGYDAQTSVLEVQYHGKEGATWQYAPVDVAIWNALIAPDASIGRMFATLVKNNPLITATRVEVSND